MSQYRLILSAGSLAILLAAATAVVAAARTTAADSGAVLRLNPGNHDFGQVVVTHSSSPLTITVTNKSKTDPVTFSSIVGAEPFSIRSDKCSGLPLAAGSSCQLEVVFSPTTAGKVNGNNAITLTDSAQNSPQQLELEGQGNTR